MFLSLWNEFGPTRKKSRSSLAQVPGQGRKSHQGTQALPVAEILAQQVTGEVPMAIPVVEVQVDQTPRPQAVRSATPRAHSVPVAKPAPAAAPPSAHVQPALPPGVRRYGSASHLRNLSPMEALLLLLGQLSALMDSKDTDDWTINPAYHPEVNEFIQKHANNAQFVARARALQKNRAPFYGKTVVPGVRRQTILAVGRQTAVAPAGKRGPAGR